MNYLAHLYLADGSADSVIGNFLGDFLKGRLANQYDERILQGVRLHRRIDTFSDTHATALRSRNRMSPYRRRFAGVIVDVGYDHFLARHWSTFTDVALSQFTTTVYEMLLVNRRVFPQRVKAVLARMAAEDWLGTYQSLPGVGLTLDRLSQRLKRENPLKGAVEEIEANYDALEGDFLSFFPELVAFVEGIRYKH